jgi:steroid delta-isomerase-like uncharacterized protein
MEDSMKKLFIVIPLVFLLGFTFACQDKEAMAELEEFKAQAKVEEQNKALIRRGYEGMNKANIEILKELFAPNLAYYNPSGSVKPLSKEEAIEFYKMLNRAWPDLNFGIQDIIAKGDMVIVRLITKGTHTGDFQGIPATGIRGESSVIFISRIQDGKIVEEWVESDMLGVMMQLGMELKPKEGEK